MIASWLFTGHNERGEEVRWHTKGWTARIVQHEMDHLEGQLFIDIMDSLTFEYDKWLRVNVRGGKYHQKFYGKVWLYCGENRFDLLQ